ncbi:MAG: acetylesterase [Chloroflexi bacterium]|nr:acetylesterase [Chloroflexota bacterium]
MTQHYEHLGIFSDLVEEARRQGPLYPVASPGPETQALVREVLGFCRGPEMPLDVRPERRWERDGLAGEELSWSVGYGPRTHAYLLRPAHAREPLPALVALHDHGGFKYYGKEKIADGPDAPPAVLVAYREQYYGGRAYANALAAEGFVVLVHDTFLWGSRRFPVETMPEEVRAAAQALRQAGSGPAWGMSAEIAEYNAATGPHEHTVSKYCNALGTNLAGVVSHEDRIAVNYLLSRPDVLRDRVGCLGLSGGGNRAALLNATHDGIAATVIVGLMSTYEGLLDHNMSHTWMFFPFGWARHGDWPDLAACRAPSPLLVQYDLEDDLFTEPGMRAADARLRDHFAGVGRPEAYTGQFYPGPHRFDSEMQAAAFAWLHERL